MNNNVVVGLLGPTLDRGDEADRWNFWRPTVSICQHEQMLVDRFDLLYEKKFRKLAQTVTEDIRSVSPETQVCHHEINFRDAWDFDDVYSGLYDFAAEYTFDTDHEDYLIHITTGTHVAQICLFLLTESRHLPGRLLQTSPPRRKSHGPVGEYRIIDLDLSRYDKIHQRFTLEQRESQDFLKSGIATRNEAFNQMIEQIEHVAIHSHDPILLTGPTGAGKSQLARRIYDLKKIRRQVGGSFVEVNCGTLRGDTAMSTLFGHKRGAFTGAMADRKGLLAEADQGLLFLDEVGELGLDEQTMLLRAVEEKAFLPVGADREVHSDFQLICGTNRNLSADVATGRFREDLLARINLWSFDLPGLSKRREDIEPNVAYELDQLAGRIGKRVRFNKEAAERFIKFATAPDAAWSANFRDLNAAISRMATMSPAGRITVEVVDQEITRLQRAWAPRLSSDDRRLNALLQPQQIDELDLFDRVQLVQVLAICRRCKSMSEAGRQLFAASRKLRKSTNDADRLRKYLARFKLSWSDIER
ncbi:sigma 54-interacting transcriptional regulator [Planctomycetales bacterium ZRK34]|nr:sigma 54-interacting transcriptional regulator [Planctomycetales bacterium ZRK34]